jgi:hypothetical protein
MTLPTNPIYDALVVEQKFDPASVTPIQTREEREVAHTIWWQQTLRKSTRPRPVKQPRKKAAS